MRRRQRPSAWAVPASHSAVGSNPMIVTEPAPYVRSAATACSPTLARARPAVSSPESAGRSVAPSGIRPSSAASDDAATSVVVVGR